MTRKNFLSLLLMALIGWGIYTGLQLLRPRDQVVEQTGQSAKNDPRFGGIEAQIETARKQVNDAALATIEQQLTKAQTDEAAYWLAYTLFQRAVIREDKKDMDGAKAYAEQALARLGKLPRKDSEDYALLSMIRAYSIQFASFFEVSSIADRAKREANAAIRADSTNLRAFYVAGLNDYHTPPMFGGRKKAESLFLKAIALGSQATHRSNVSWGLKQAYANLEQFYKEAGNARAAQRIKEQATHQPDQVASIH